jgi:arabinogalactan oligomer/maltooligosaccharide transport system permease protein
MATITQPALSQSKSRGSEFRKRLRESRTPWLYILPAGLLMLLITIIPQIFQVVMAFTDYRIRNLRFNPLLPESYEFFPDWVGLDNFVKVITSDIAIPNYNFARMFGFNLFWTVSNVFFHVILGVAIAMALNYKSLLGRRVYRAIFILPWAIPGLITAQVWANMFHPRFGAVNQLITSLNAALGTSFNDGLRWLQQTDAEGLLFYLPLSYFAALIVNVWLGWPFMTVVATGALQSIPGDMYEAAEIDGASKWQQFWAITVPLIRPAMVPAIMLGTIMTFNNFNVIYFVTRGGPAGRTEIMVTQAFKLVFEQRLYGVASAFAIIVFFILLALTLLQNYVTRATESYDV